MATERNDTRLGPLGILAILWLSAAASQASGQDGGTSHRAAAAVAGNIVEVSARLEETNQVSRGFGLIIADGSRGGLPVLMILVPQHILRGKDLDDRPTEISVILQGESADGFVDELHYSEAYGQPSPMSPLMNPNDDLAVFSVPTPEGFSWRRDFLHPLGEVTDGDRIRVVYPDEVSREAEVRRLEANKFLIEYPIQPGDSGLPVVTDRGVVGILLNRFSETDAVIRYATVLRIDRASTVVKDELDLWWEGETFSNKQFAISGGMQFGLQWMPSSGGELRSDPAASLTLAASSRHLGPELGVELNLSEFPNYQRDRGLAVVSTPSTPRFALTGRFALGRRQWPDDGSSNIRLLGFVGLTPAESSRHISRDVAEDDDLAAGLPVEDGPYRLGSLGSRSATWHVGTELQYRLALEGPLIALVGLRLGYQRGSYTGRTDLLDRALIPLESESVEIGRDWESVTVLVTMRLELPF